MKCENRKKVSLENASNKYKFVQVHKIVHESARQMSLDKNKKPVP